MLAYITLLPIAILVGFVTLIVFKRELHTVSTVHVNLMFKGREYKTVGLSDVYTLLLCFADFFLCRAHLERSCELGVQAHSKRAAPMCRYAKQLAICTVWSWQCCRCTAMSPSKFRHMIRFLHFQSFGHHE